MKKLIIKYRWKIAGALISALLGALLIFSLLRGKNGEDELLEAALDWAVNSRTRALESVRRHVEREGSVNKERLEEIDIRIKDVESKREVRDERIRKSDLRELDSIFDHLLEETG